MDRSIFSDGFEWVDRHVIAAEAALKANQLELHHKLSGLIELHEEETGRSVAVLSTTVEDLAAGLAQRREVSNQSSSLDDESIEKISSSALNALHTTRSSTFHSTNANDTINRIN